LDDISGFVAPGKLVSQVPRCIECVASYVLCLPVDRLDGREWGRKNDPS